MRYDADSFRGGELGKEPALLLRDGDDRVGVVIRSRPEQKVLGPQEGVVESALVTPGRMVMGRGHPRNLELPGLGGGLQHMPIPVRVGVDEIGLSVGEAAHQSYNERHGEPRDQSLVDGIPVDRYALDDGREIAAPDPMCLVVKVAGEHLHILPVMPEADREFAHDGFHASGGVEAERDLGDLHRSSTSR